MNEPTFAGLLVLAGAEPAHGQLHRHAVGQGRRLGRRVGPVPPALPAGRLRVAVAEVDAAERRPDRAARPCPLGRHDGKGTRALRGRGRAGSGRKFARKNFVARELTLASVGG